MRTGLMGLGAIGTPIAHRQFMHYRDDFVLLASEEIKQMLLSQETRVNGDLVNPRVLSGADASLLDGPLDLILICIKNYDLKSSIRDIVTKHPIMNQR